MSHDRRIAACQFEPTIADVEANCERIATHAAALDDDIAIAVFPELSVTGYDLDAATSLATPIPGPVTDDLAAIADAHDTGLIVGLAEQVDSVPYNSLVFVDGTGVRATYRKQWLWGTESEVFAAGSGPAVVETALGTVGFVLCYDLNFPETALAYAKQECDVLVASAAWRRFYRDGWELLCRARALDGTCYVVGSNQAGEQGGRRHEGHSLIAGPNGAVIEEAGDGATVVTAEMRETTMWEARGRNPVLASRREQLMDKEKRESRASRTRSKSP